jgi:hypothetical protein
VGVLALLQALLEGVLVTTLCFQQLPQQKVVVEVVEKALVLDWALVYQAVLAVAVV